MAYSRTLRALEAYPKKELSCGNFMHRDWPEGPGPAIGICHCAIGAAVAQAGGTPNTYVPRLWAFEAEELGLTGSQIDEVVSENDRFGGTRAERYAHMIEYLRRRVRENRATQKARKAAKASAR